MDPSTTTPARYCLYARKSSEQDERQALSIDAQIKELLELAEREKLAKRLLTHVEVRICEHGWS